jgi:nucleotide-binding universal stress UspA family protein
MRMRGGRHRSRDGLRGSENEKEGPMSERILVCTHGEAGALGALRLANALAMRDGCRVDVLAVVAPVFMEGVTLYSLPGRFVSAEGEWVDEYRERIRRQLRGVGGAVAAVEPRVEIGHVAHTIATYAQDHGDALIVLGAESHGRAERWTGSETSLYVARLARVPVLAVPAHAGELPRAAVAAVDFSEYSRDAALAAAKLLRSEGRLHLVHATWLEPAEASGADEWLATYRSGAHARLSELARELRAQTSVHAIDTEVAAGDPAERVLELARDTGAELVAAGSHGYGFFTRMLLGSTSTELLRGARCAVLIVPPRAASRELARAAESRDRRARRQAGSLVSMLAS